MNEHNDREKWNPDFREFNKKSGEMLERIRQIEAAVMDLQTRELNREDSDDEEIRLESELGENSIPASVTGAIYSLYDQLTALLTTGDLALTVIEDMPSTEFYEDTEHNILEWLALVSEAKNGVGNFISSHTPDYFQREVEEGIEEDD